MAGLLAASLAKIQHGWPDQAIKEASVGSCDSCISLDEEIAAMRSNGRNHLSRTVSYPNGCEAAELSTSPTEPCLLSDPLTEMSHALHAVAGVLKTAADREAKAVEEALEWKAKYKELLEQTQKQKSKEEEERDGGGPNQQQLLLRSLRAQAPGGGASTCSKPQEDDEASGSSNGNTPCHCGRQRICDRQVLRSGRLTPQGSLDGRLVAGGGEQTVVGSCEESQTALGRNPADCQVASPGRCLFRLAWRAPEGEIRKQRHRHDVVSYASGHISSMPQHSKQIMLRWESPPKTALLVRKPHSAAVDSLIGDLIRWLSGELGMVLLCEPEVQKALKGKGHTELQTWKDDEELQDLSNRIDCVISLGGDGTVLWASSLFKGPVPPLMSFAMGSLGFMTPFRADRYQELLTKFFQGPVYLTLRSRLQCRIIRGIGEEEAGDLRGYPVSEDKMVLNEVAIDRGMSSFLTNLDCYCDGLFVTSVQGDGLIVSTPSGSTAYSLAAGGSMVHPQVPGMLFTPICPHSLSFRPLILPEYVTLRVQVPQQSRGQAWVSFDGKDRQQLSAGDALVVQMSRYPVPAASPEEATSSFLRSVRDGLHWNLRKAQD